MSGGWAIGDILVKVDRAKEHLKALNAEIDRFTTEKPYALHVVTEYWNDQVRDVVWLRDPPGRWSALIGDCVHNLRSALDHIAWVLSGGDGNAPSHTEFPIFVDQEKYFKRTPKGPPQRGSGLWKIEAVQPHEAWAVFRRLQPFQRPDPTGHPLWVLHELDRLDKHRRLHLITNWAYTDLWRRGIHTLDDLPPGWRQLRATASPVYPAERRPGRRQYVKMRADLAMRVAVESEVTRADENIDVVLAGLIAFIEDDVLPPFKPFLPSVD